jgi:hypothetical protein
LIDAVEKRRNDPEFKARLARFIETGSRAARASRQVTVRYPDLADYIAIALNVESTSCIANGVLVCCPVRNSEKIAKVGISAETGAFSPV